MVNPSRTGAVRAATLADVGKAAGVSAMAASAVLNGARTSSRISAETRERILAAARKLNYRPNAAARALASRSMQTIGVAAVLSSGELNYYILEVLNGILAAADAQKQNVTVFTLHDWGVDSARLHGLCDGRIDGLILIAPTLTAAAAKQLPDHTPFVALHANTALPNVINIESDEEHGAYQMVRYLLAQGHRRILHVSGPRGLLGAERRISGFKRALAGARLRFDETAVVPAKFDTFSAREVLRGWLAARAGQPLPDAIFAANDSIAVGCLEVLAELGLRVPDDISVVGFDDSLAARTTVPQLTTVRQPLPAMGQRAVEVLLDRIQRHDGRIPEGQINPIVFPVDLVMRASVAPPPKEPRLIPAAVGARR